MGSDTKKILIIEDEKPLARALELKLMHEGFEVKILPNGEGAISLIETERFSFLICDLVMPKVDGFDILREIKEAVTEDGIPLEIALQVATSNPADILKLTGKGYIQEGFDAVEEWRRVFFTRTGAGGTCCRWRTTFALSSTIHSTVSPLTNSMAFATAVGKLTYH